MKETQTIHEDILIKSALPKLRELATVSLPEQQKIFVGRLITEISKLTSKQAKPELSPWKDFKFELKPGQSIANELSG
jgi:hypothetical protein